MEPELVICIPGPWKSSKDLQLALLKAEPKESFLYAGRILMCRTNNDHIVAEFCSKDDNIPRAFQFAGQGKVSEFTQTLIVKHESAVYAHFPLDIVGQKDRITIFSSILKQAGGFAVKVESTGIAHEWDNWFRALNGTLHQLYCASIVLVGDKEVLYSCGMHNFGKPDVSVPASLGVDEGANLMNVFNMWIIEEAKNPKSGNTFSIDTESKHFRMNLIEDSRHGHNTLFRNPYGLWSLQPV